MTAALENRRLKYAVEACANGVWGDEPNGEDDLVVVRVADFDREKGVVSLGDVPTVRAIPESARNRRVLAPGDLLLEKSGGGEQQPVGNVVLFRDTCPAVCSNFVARMPVKADCDSRYVAYVFRSLYAEGRNVPHVKQTSGIQNLDSESYLNEVAWLPPKPDQERIANFLDEQTARIDALIAEKERLDGRLQEYRLSLISAAVTGQIDGENTDKAGVSQSWPTRRLRYVAELNPAVRPDLVAAQDTEVTFLPMDAIGEDGSLNLERVRPVAEVRNGYSYFEDGDVAFAKVTPCFENGKGALMRNLQFGAGFGTTELTVLRPKVGTCASFLRYVLQSENFRRNGAGAMTGAGGLKRVPDDFTRDFETPWPPHSEQERIAAFLDEQTNRIDALRHHVREHIERLREYRSSLISAAVTGQLDLSTFKASA